MWKPNDEFLEPYSHGVEAVSFAKPFQGVREQVKHLLS
jgi:hypothetical protein